MYDMSHISKKLVPFLEPATQLLKTMQSRLEGGTNSPLHRLEIEGGDDFGVSNVSSCSSGGVSGGTEETTLTGSKRTRGPNGNDGNASSS
jgi:hypothetical protein